MGILDKRRKPFAVQSTDPPLDSHDVDDFANPWWLEPGAPSTDNSSPAPAPDPPSTPAAPCPDCGGCFLWQTLAGDVRCCECVRVPARAMLVELWRVITPTGDAAGPYGWERWEPRGHWNPFGHLDAAREIAEAKAAAEETF